jgi:hypothetical protein
MKSYRKKVMRDIEEDMKKKHERVGRELVRAARSRILQYGLVETGLMLGEVTAIKTDDGVDIGIPEFVPNYPAFLHQGFRHWRSHELVGPYPYLTDAANDTRQRVRQIYEG